MDLKITDSSIIIIVEPKTMMKREIGILYGKSRMNLCFGQEKE